MAFRQWKRYSASQVCRDLSSLPQSLSHALENSCLTSGFSRFCKGPSVRVLTVLSSLLVFWIYYGKSHFYRDPGSWFYDGSRAFEKRYSSIRAEEARAYLNSLEFPEEKKQHEGNTSVLVCGVLLSVVRPGGTSYLEDAVASALESQSQAERSTLQLSTFFATSNPGEHAAFNKSRLRELVDNVYTYENVLSSLEWDYASGLESTNDTQKQAYDYATALRLCQDTEAKYFAIFEDDIIFAKGWLARTLIGLKEVEDQMKHFGREGEWLYLRLFNQERSIGWANRHIGGNHEAEISSGIALVICVLYRFGCQRSHAIRESTNIWTLFIGLLFVPIFVVLFFQSGKASMLPPQPGVREENFGCCSQALIFNREHIGGLAEYIDSHKNGSEQYDMLTRDYAVTYSLARWSQYPVMVQHVGTISTVETSTKDSEKVWSMAFENLDSSRLEREHEDSLRKLFG